MNIHLIDLPLPVQTLDLAQHALLARLHERDRRALARLISLAEDRATGIGSLLQALKDPGHVTGITGPPGAGKSTMLDRLVGLHRARQQEVAVVAVDPTSPFTGGAILGDRIRMHAHAVDPGVYIRSMASRGSLGGLAEAAGDALRLIGAFGFPWIYLETVGVGQTEVEVISHADTVVVALVPESGDAIQVLKAGLLETADIFVVNKADREGADRLADDLSGLAYRGSARSDGAPAPGWNTRVLQTRAVEGGGIDDLAAEIARHRAWLESSGELGRRRATRRRRKLRELLLAGLARRVDEALASASLATLVRDVEEGRLDPRTAAALARAAILDDVSPTE